MPIADLNDFRRELGQRAAKQVEFTDWDAYILGTTQTLHSETTSAGEAAQREEERWSQGRFPTVQLAIADSLFSKVRKYHVAVRNDVRPFAIAFGNLPLREFEKLEWPDVFRGTYGLEPKLSATAKPHHLSNEGRCVSIVTAALEMLSAGLETPELVRAAIALPGGDAKLRRTLARAPGMGPALQAYTLMNLGHLTLKADRHVIRVAAPFLGLQDNASPAAFEHALVAAAPHLGMSPFVIDQVLWYTEAAPGVDSVSDSDHMGAPTATQVQRTPLPLPAATDSPRLNPGEPLAGRIALATTRDIQPNKPVPVMELRFAKSDADALPPTNKGPLRLKLGEEWWLGTIGLTANNPPYVHTNLSSGPNKRSMTELLMNLGVRERGELEFRCVEVGVLELTRIVKAGEWREGSNRPH